jgi:hypothetical protein
MRAIQRRRLLIRVDGEAVFIFSQLLRLKRCGGKLEAASRTKRRRPPELYGGSLRFVKANF